ncbi:sortase domain-bontaining protein [Lacticaseibacillus jixianensis]|uniref:Sortase domain-bontaining protein n=1 Tax=Lacticaseibacillus jixianensis TaxID=2486012 RepID=A0ABW4BBP6_9LACO|nr:sortase [Lacticaseibacillus jixianensis]
MKLNKQVLLLGAVVVLALGVGVSTAVVDASEPGAPEAAQVTVAAQTKGNTTASRRGTLASTGHKKAVKKTVAKKTVKKAVAKKTVKKVAKKAVAKKAVKKVAKKTVAKKAVKKIVKKPVAKKPVAKKVVNQPVVKEAAVKRVVTRVTPAQQAAAKAASIRRTTGETYVGTISGLGHTTDVIQGSLSRTKAPANAGMAMTWGGATNMTTTDGLTSEIAGHAKSNTFAWIMGLRNGSQVSVTDAQGHSRSYHVYMTDDVNDDSYSVKNGADRLNAIISAHQGEAVVLQTCITNTVNRIVWAR